MPTYAVLSLQNGDDIKTVQGNLGHATAAFTLDVYGHAAGRITTRVMGAAFTNGIVVSAGYLAGIKIGGIIGQALGFELPIVGYLLGSLVGCAFSAVYNIGRKHLISFCVDTGFTCFVLVEQNYELPSEVLADMGIDIVPVPRVNVERTELESICITEDISRINFETINLTILRRGVIGVNKVGYVI